MYDPGNSLQGLGRASVREGGCLSFIGSIVNKPLMAVHSDKWLRWVTVPTNQKRPLVCGMDEGGDRESARPFRTYILRDT